MMLLHHDSNFLWSLTFRVLSASICLTETESLNQEATGKFKIHIICYHNGFWLRVWW